METAFSRPAGTEFRFVGADPALKTPGYFQMSLRDKSPPRSYTTFRNLKNRLTPVR